MVAQSLPSLPHDVETAEGSSTPTTVVLSTPKLGCKDGDDDRHFEAVLESSEDPLQMSLAHKWLIVAVISSSALCVTCASSISGLAESAEAEAFHVSTEVTILGISLFIEGLGVGPLLLGPMSEFYGRNDVYRWSYSLYFICSLPVAFAPNIVVFLIFRFLCGFCGSAFLSVAGGTVSDLFLSEDVTTPMAIYTLCPFLGPVGGPLISGFVNQHLEWRWTYRVQIIWTFVQLIALWIFVPETYKPILLKHKAQRLRKSTGNNKYWAPIEHTHKGLVHSMIMSCFRPFELLAYDLMTLLLDIWSALVLGILYLAFEAFPIIFGEIHGFDTQAIGLSFVGIGIGMFIALASQPLWNRLHDKAMIKYKGCPPPEMHLYMGTLGGVLVSLSLFWLAFTTYPNVHWIAPIIASVPFGTGVLFVFTSTFTYLVVAYRPIAASALAANSALRSTFAAIFPLFAVQMYHRLGTVGATALLAGLATVMAPFPFILCEYGARIRARSKFAVH